VPKRARRAENKTTPVGSHRRGLMLTLSGPNSLRRGGVYNAYYDDYAHKGETGRRFKGWEVIAHNSTNHNIGIRPRQEQAIRLVSKPGIGQRDSRGSRDMHRQAKEPRPAAGREGIETDSRARTIRR
jgi:hypothetical protein